MENISLTKWSIVNENDKNSFRIQQGPITIENKNVKLGPEENKNTKETNNIRHFNFLELMEKDARKFGVSENAEYLEAKNKIEEIFYKEIFKNINKNNEEILKRLDEINR